MNIKNFRDLKVWQKSMDLVVQVYQATEGLPKAEQYGLTNQIRRAAVSIPSNIAEGHSRGTKEFIHFLKIAKGSLAELETQLELAMRLNYLEQETFLSLQERMTEISKMISGLKRKLDP